MKATLPLAGLLAALACIAGCGQKAETPDVALVFDIGGRGDKSFNDLAYAALQRGQKELGVTVDYFEPTEGADRESALRRYAARKIPLIIGVGFAFSDDIVEVARSFPESRFVCVDYTVKYKDDAHTQPIDLPKNFVGLKYREEEGTYLVGAIAALCSETGTVGFVGGMDIPLIRKFEAGYRAGAVSVRPGARVLVNYAGSTPEAFKNPSKGKELALSMYNMGADVIMHASGSTGLGVFAAAKEKGKLAIGVDSDQQAEAPGHVLTSMIKKIDDSLFSVMKEVKEGTFKEGVRWFGLKEGFVGYVYDDDNKKWITDEIRAKVEDLSRKIVAGEITVPKTPPGR